MTQPGWRYPPSIEPTQASVTVYSPDASDAVRLTLQRIDSVAEPYAYGAAHFFADSDSIETIQLVLGYDLRGRLAAIGTRAADGDLVMSAVPEEVRGTGVAHPSCRLIFEDDESCAELYYALTDYTLEKQQLSASDVLADTDAMQEAMVRILSAIERVKAVCVIPVAREETPA